MKAVLDYLDIQKPTGIGMLLTEIGKLQDKGLNPIFSKKVDEHMQSHSCQEIVSRSARRRQAMRRNSRSASARFSPRSN